MCAAAITPKPVPIVAAIPVACGVGALDPGCKDGPAAFRQYWARHACSRYAALAWEPAPGNLYMEDGTPLEIVARTSRWLAWTTRRVTQRGKRFLVIGGDQSCAIGTWSGASDALRRFGAFSPARDAMADCERMVDCEPRKELRAMMHESSLQKI